MWPGQAPASNISFDISLTTNNESQNLIGRASVGDRRFPSGLPSHLVCVEPHPDCETYLIASVMPEILT